MNLEVKQWIDMAVTDYEVAKHLHETYVPEPLEIVCYHCQQSAEKAIKAVIIAFHASASLPKKHDLSYLLNQINDTINIDDRYFDCADALTPYGVAVRYPNNLNLSALHAREAIQYADELLDWAKTTILTQISSTDNE